MGSSGKSAGTTSPLTTKGDLWGFDTANNRIPVGSNTQVLTADSTQALGLKWAAGGVSFPLTNASDEGFQPNGIATNTLNLHNPASAVNGVQITGSVSGSAPVIAPVGSDSGITLLLQSKGPATFVQIASVSNTGQGLVVNGNSTSQTADLLDITQNGGLSGNLLFSFTTVASAANGISFAATALGGSPVIAPIGGDTAISLNITTKQNGTLFLKSAGTGNVNIAPNGVANSSAIFTQQVSAVNNITFTGTSTGNAPSIAATGTDTNIALALQSKGTGAVGIQPGGVNILLVTTQASAVNGLTLLGTATGTDPQLTVTGDANRSLLIQPNGTGTIAVRGAADSGVPMQIQGNSATQTGDLLDIYQNNGGSAMFKFTTVASAVNGLQFLGAATGGRAIVSANGTDTNVTLRLRSQGSNPIEVMVNSSAGSVMLGSTSQMGTAGRTALTATGVAAGVNGITATQTATGASPSLAATGSDTNIDLTVNGTGTGVVNFGYASTAISGATPATIATGTGGATGPATAAQNAWLAVKINGTTSYIPFWR